MNLALPLTSDRFIEFEANKIRYMCVNSTLQANRHSNISPPLRTRSLSLTYHVFRAVHCARLADITNEI